MPVNRVPPPMAMGCQRGRWGIPWPWEGGGGHGGGILRITLLSATRTHYMSSDVGLRSWAEGRPGSRHTMDDGDDEDDDDDDDVC